MKLHHSLYALALLAAVPAAAQDEPSGKSTAAIDLVVNGQIRRVVVELDDQSAPQTVANFVKLSQSGFYNGLAVHRAIPNYVVQMGDPYTRDESQKHLWGTGGPDHSVPAEVKAKHERGSVAMARMPNSNASSGSQFYITLGSQPQLDGKYSVFAKVIRGIEHLDYVAGSTVDTNDVPISRIEINAVTVAIPGVEPASNPNAAILANAAGAASAAGTAVRNAGQKVAEAVPDKMPKGRLPKLLPFGRNRDAVPPPPAPETDATPEPDPSPTVASTDTRVPPEFDMLEDEVLEAPTFVPATADLDPAPAPEPGPQITEDPGTKRKLLTLPVPKGKRSGEKSLMTRVIERVW